MNTDNCNWQWTTENGVDGYKVTSKKNGNSIFLPTTGYRYETKLFSASSRGSYWGSSPNAKYGDSAYCIDFASSVSFWGLRARVEGFPIRPVTD